MTYAQSLFQTLSKGIRWTFLHRALFALSGLGISVLSARMLGAAGYGALQYVLGVLQIVLVLGAFGFSQVVIRETANSSSISSWGPIRGILRFIVPVTAILTAVTALGAAGLSIWPLYPDLIWLFALGVVATLLRQLAGPYIAFLNGLGRIGLSGTGEMVRNLVILTVLGAVFFAPHTSALEPISVMFIRTIGAAIGLATLLVSSVTVARRLPGGFYETAPAYDTLRWLQNGFSLIIVSAAAVIFTNADILMIGALLDTDYVGPYHAATRAADLVAFTLAITITPLGPMIVRLYSAGKTGELRALVSRSTRINILIGAAFGTILVIFAGPLLQVFGPEFDSASTALRILVVAQFLNVAVGPVQLLLVMTGHQKFAALGVLVAAVINIALNAVLIPVYGILGAAVATAVSVIAWNLVLLVIVRRKIWTRQNENSSK